MKKLITLLTMAVVAAACSEKPDFSKLPDDSIVDEYVSSFNAADNETYRNTYSNADAAGFLKGNIPLFECPDKELETTYYFRWWTFRKHVNMTPMGYVITEFLPKISYAGKFNTINCPAEHHLNEARWLVNKDVFRDYAYFWLDPDGGKTRNYCFPVASALYNGCRVIGDEDMLVELYTALKRNYSRWEQSHRDSTGLFWQKDGYDGMEESVGGSFSEDNTGYRATINSYMYADAVAISKIAAMAGDRAGARLYKAKADTLYNLVNSMLWDTEDDFYKVIPRHGDMTKVGCRELHGYIPWIYGLADASKDVAWRQLFDPQGFYATYGPTTAEQRDPGFKIAYEGHACQWNGPSWPYATSQTLTAMANCMHTHGTEAISGEEFMDILNIYSNSHRRILEDGTKVCWIDENLNPYTGEWLARTIHILDGTALKRPEKGKDYNHSSFVDIIISGVAGISVNESGDVEVKPLVPEGYWDYWCIENVMCAGKDVTVVYDKTGDKYGLGKGLMVWVDGKRRK